MTFCQAFVYLLSDAVSALSFLAENSFPFCWFILRMVQQWEVLVGDCRMGRGRNLSQLQGGVCKADVSLLRPCFLLRRPVVIPASFGWLWPVGFGDTALPVFLQPGGSRDFLLLLNPASSHPTPFSFSLFSLAVTKVC